MLRARIRARRAERSPDASRAAAAALGAHARGCDAQIVAAFVPVRGEPGTTETLDILRTRAQVLLPVVVGPGELGWAPYDGPEGLVTGPFGLRQPAAAVPGLSLATVEVVIVPALALTLRGERLGQGGGFYDRALAGIETERIVGLVHDDEVLESLPTQPHDLRVGWVLTPSALRRSV